MTAKDFANKLRDYARNKQKEFVRIAAVQAINQSGAEFENRVFKDGKDSNGAKIGKYRSKKHIAARQAAGRQTAFKDYHFTGSLQGAVRKVEYTGVVALAIVDSVEIEKSRKLEKMDKRAVFVYSKSENQTAFDTMEKVFNKLTNSIF